MEYDLWVDESGDFGKEEKPSLVGGFLVKSGTLDHHHAKKILEKALERDIEKGEWPHATDVPKDKFGKIIMSIISQLKSANAKIVVFENNESKVFSNTAETYLNVLAEGIIQLIKENIVVDKSFTLNAYIARKMYKPNNGDLQEIFPEEYKKILSKKIKQGFVRRNIKFNENYLNIFIKSARTETELFLCDFICHTYYRRENKLSISEKEYLAKVSSDDYYFTAIDTDNNKYMKELIYRGSVGEALFEWLLMNDSASLKKRDDFLQDVIKTMNIMLPELRASELRRFIEKMKLLTNSDRDFFNVSKMVQMIKEELIPQLNQYHLMDDTFLFNINFLELTNSTHQGQVNTEENLIKKVRPVIMRLANRLEDMQLLVDFTIREAVHDMNVYHFEKAENDMDRLLNFLDGIMDIIPIAYEEQLGMEYVEIKSRLKGKVLGNKLQINLLLSRNKPELLDVARTASDNALEEFTTRSDLMRQYQYRCQIENEAHNFQEAIQWLAKSLDISFVGNNLDEVVTKIIDLKSNATFMVMHYVKIMAMAKKTTQYTLADDMYRTLTRDEFLTGFLNEMDKNHPAEIIYWNLAIYLLRHGNTSQAILFYKKAWTICFRNKEDLTLYSVGLLILADEIGELLMLQKKSQIPTIQDLEKELRKKYETFNKLKKPQPMNHFFKDWAGTINGNYKNPNEKSKAFKMLSESAAY